VTVHVASRTVRLLTPSADVVEDDVVDRLRNRLVRGIGAVAGDRPPGAPVEITLPGIRRVRTRPETVGLAEPPFAWKPAFVRRSLGLAAVRVCAEGRFRGPAAAVGPLADAAVDEWRRTGWRTFHWEPWFAGLGPGGRAAVLAEAVTWATPLWTAVDWSVPGPRSVRFGADDSWTCPGPPTVRLKGRLEARVNLDPPVRGDRGDGPSALVSVAGGIRGDGWQEELGYLALAAGLRYPDLPVPSRVLGLWPDTGEHRLVEIDAALLDRAVDLVVATVAVMVEARTACASVMGGVDCVDIVAHGPAPVAAVAV
jgi:hypothetical protein